MFNSSVFLQYNTIQFYRDHAQIKESHKPRGQDSLCLGFIQRNHKHVM